MEDSYRVQMNKEGHHHIIGGKFNGPTDIVKTIDGKPCSYYYYEGNIFGPLAPVDGRYVAAVKVAIRKFMKSHSEMIAADRGDDNYKTLVQLFDEQEREHGKSRRK